MPLSTRLGNTKEFPQVRFSTTHSQDPIAGNQETEPLDQELYFYDAAQNSFLEHSPSASTDYNSQVSVLPGYEEIIANFSQKDIEHHKDYFNELIDYIKQVNTDYCYQLANMRQERYNAIRDLIALKTYIAEKESLLAEKEAQIAEKITLLNQKDAIITEKDSLLATKDSLLCEKEAQIFGSNSLLTQRDATIAKPNSAYAPPPPRTLEKGFLVYGFVMAYTLYVTLGEQHIRYKPAKEEGRLPYLLAAEEYIFGRTGLHRLGDGVIVLPERKDKDGDVEYVCIPIATNISRGSRILPPEDSLEKARELLPEAPRWCEVFPDEVRNFITF